MDKYTTQFKLDAIQAFLERGRGFRHIGARFGVDPTLLRRWVAAYRLHGEAGVAGRRNNGSHSATFKLLVLQRLLADNLSFRQAAAVFNLGNATQVGIWQQQYYSGGFNALIPGQKGSDCIMPKLPPKPRNTAPVDPEKLSHAELTRAFRKLEAENAYLKKLKEWQEAEEAKAQSRPKKPG